jgi:endonuclease/exonuclease/phosphatase family metal-dependent hydrolase
MKRIIWFCLCLAISVSLVAQDWNVASYNIRCTNRSDDAAGNGWERRCPEVVNLIRSHRFDLFGAQEVTHTQLLDLQQALPDYGFVGVGRDDGKEKGEYAPIFYRKTEFSLLNSGTFWLAPLDSQPTVGWDAALPRICTWARLQSQGGIFWVFNLHMDHLGKLARLESAKLVLRKIREFSPTEPVLLLGDFNMDQTSPGYKVLNESELLEDAFRLTEAKSPIHPTFNDYRLDTVGDSRIDHLFVSKHWEVLRYDILTDTYEADTTRLPSDHYPVRIRLRLKN